MKFLDEIGVEKHRSATDAMAKNGQLEALKCAHELGIPIFTKVYRLTK